VKNHCSNGREGKMIMEFKPIHSEKEYEAALAAVEPYFDQEPAEGSIEADRFEIVNGN
jgi:HTH-type transcriptional regulator/antitoxin HigA